MNFILLAVSMLVVIIGFVLMGGASSTADAFNPDIFSARRIKVAPLVCLFGFVMMVYAVVHKSKDSRDDEVAATPVETTEIPVTNS